MRSETMGSDDVNKRGNNLLPPTADEEETMDSSLNRWNDSIGKDIGQQDVPLTPNRHSRRGRGRRRPSIVPVVPANDPSLSPKALANGRQHYSQQLAFHGPKPTNENLHYSQQLAFNSSMASTDWGSTSSQGSSKREHGRKKANNDESLVFDDDDLSLSLHQAFTDDDDEDDYDDTDTSEKRSSLAESGYQLSTVISSMQDSVLDRSYATNLTPIASVAEVSTSSSSTNERVEIWGREKELSSLQSRFLATCSTPGNSSNIAPKHVWVSGVSGIGKSSLVDAFLSNENLSTTQPLICRGAFKENWMDASKAYPGIMSCFNDLFQSFLDGNEREEWGERVQACVDDKDVIALLVSLIPSLAILLDVGNDDTKYSFEKDDRNLFGRLSRALGHLLLLACEYSTIIFSLDDVQWATDDSLQLLKAILFTKGLSNFFFVGCYRSGIKVSHSLNKIKADVQELFGADIKLGGIGIKSARLLVRTQLRFLDSHAVIDARMLDSVMKLWYKHSSSRIPIYLKHLVHRLHEKGGFRVKKKGWILDSPKILPSSSLSLLVERVEDLCEDCDLVLKSAALLDTNDFNIDMLMVAIAANNRSRTVEIDIETLENILGVLSDKMLIEEQSPGRYDFAHNIVKVAVSAKLSVATKRRRSGLHWRIATDLKKMKDDAATLQSETSVGFESLLIANHFNKGLLSIEDRRKIDMVVKLYLQLGEAAMKKSAFITAANILETAVAALDKKSKWEESYVLTLKTHLALAQSLYCSGELDRAKPILNTIIANGRTPRDMVDAFDLLISIYRSKMQYEQAKQFTLKALTDIFEDDVGNANVEERFSKIRERVQKKSDADLLVLPDLEHKKTTKEMPFLLQLAEISGLCRDFKLQDLAALRMIDLTLKYGSYETNFTGLCFAYFGFCVARRHLHGEAYRYGRLAEMMSEKDNTLGRQAIVYHNFDLRHWRNQMRGGRKILKDISRTSMEENEIENISFQVGAYLSAILYTGTPLNSEDIIIKLYDKKRKQYELPGHWNVIAPFNALVKLKGENSKLMKRKYVEERAFQYDIFFQMVEAVFMYDMDKADKLNGKLLMKPRGCWVSYRLFMEGLIATYYARVLTGKGKLLYQKKASKSIEILTTWAKIGMKNSAHMANILNVELKIASDNGVSPKRLSILFDTAISSAYQDGFPHHAALASERAGMYFVKIEDETLASKFLSRSSILYAEWGAAAKVKQLESGYGKYLTTDPTQIRSLKKTNAIPAGSLMFTDRKLDHVSQRSGRTATHRSRSQSVARSHVNSSRRSSSTDSRKKSALNGKKSPNNANNPKTQSLHLRGRPVLSKAAKQTNGQRSQSVTQRRSSLQPVSQKRPSLIRVGSWASMTSLISNVSEDKTNSNSTNSRRGTKKKLLSVNKTKEEKGKFQKFARRNSASSIPSMEKDTQRDFSDGSERKTRGTSSKGGKGKFQKFGRRNSTSSIPTMDDKEIAGGEIAAPPLTAKEEKGKFQKFKRRNSTSSIPDNLNNDKPTRKKKGEEAEDITLTPTQPKKKAFKGPIPSPGPRKAKLILANDDLSGRSYLLDYDTDDFETVNGDDTMRGDGDDSIISFNSDKESDESDVETKPKTSPKKSKKKTKKTTKKKKKDLPIEESPVTTDVLKTPKRRTKNKVAAVKSKTISL